MIMIKSHTQKNIYSSNKLTYLSPTRFNIDSIESMSGRCLFCQTAKGVGVHVQKSGFLFEARLEINDAGSSSSYRYYLSTIFLRHLSF